MTLQHDYSAFGDSPDTAHLTETQLLQKEQQLEAENAALFNDLWTQMDAMPRHGAKHSMDAFLIAGHEFAISIHEAQVDHHKHLDNVADKLADLFLTALRAGARQGLTLTDIAHAVARKQEA